jgi:ferredoxin, 2Fe-2S
MECAVHNGISGIHADCFGEGGCATCHVYVHPTWWATIGQPCVREKSTLRFAFRPRTHSRLSCYIRIVEELDGLVVHLPERQF